MECKYIMKLNITFALLICIYCDEIFSLNEKFIATYDRARSHLISTMNPLIICSGDNAIVIHRGKRYEEQVIPKVYHELKSISHIPLKIYLTLVFNSGKLSEENYTELKQYLHDLRLLRNIIQLPIDIQEQQYKIIDLSIAYLRIVLKTKYVDMIQFEKFCQQSQRLFTINLKYSARAHLDMLDLKIKPWYEQRFNDSERKSVKILIMGSKSARHGFLEKAYFYSLLKEHHEGEHIIFVESISNEEQALGILGAWVLDAKASRMFFSGDSERLHQDILGDAAKSYIKRLFDKSKCSYTINFNLSEEH